MGAESEGAQVEILRLTDYKIGPCRGCGLCLFRENVCQVKDDDVSFIFSKMNECDGVILGSPCYFLELTAVIKQLIDRLRSAKYRGLDFAGASLEQISQKTGRNFNID